MIPPVDIYEDGIYYYVFFPSSDTDCLLMSPWGNLYGWEQKNNPKLYRNYLGDKVNFKNCPFLVQKAIKKEWGAQ